MKYDPQNCVSRMWSKLVPISDVKSCWGLCGMGDQGNSWPRISPTFPSPLMPCRFKYQQFSNSFTSLIFFVFFVELLFGSWIFSPPWTEVKRGGVFIKSLQVLTKYCCRQWCSVAALSYYGVKYDPRRRNWGGLLPLLPGLLLEKGERGKTGVEQSLKVNRPSKKQ